MTSAVEWLRTTTPGLLVLCGLAIAILLFTIIRVKLEPFVALLLAGLGLAWAAGLPVKDIVGTAIKSGDSLLETGFGSILGHIAVIIGGQPSAAEGRWCCMRCRRWPDCR